MTRTEKRASPPETEQRKADHIRINLDEDVSFRGVTTGLERLLGEGPAVAGLSPGLPVGLQLMGPLLGEATLLRAAWAFEQEFGFDPTPRGPNAVALPEGVR